MFHESSWCLTDVHWDPVAMRAEVRGAEAHRPSDGVLQPSPFVAPRADGPGNGAAAPSEPPTRVACLVPGCTSDSATWTVYSQRTRLCGRHMRSEVLKLPEGPRRFCQKCNRLHTLDKVRGCVPARPDRPMSR